jgi:hypothetical protein
MDEMPQDSRGRILFGLKMSVAYPTVSTLHTSRREEKPTSLVPFVGSSFRPSKHVGPHKEFQNSGR